LKIVLDTSVLVNGQIVKQIESGLRNDSEIIIPAAVLDELQSQASKKHEQGFLGLEQIKTLQSISKKHNLTIVFQGKRPSVDDVRLSGRGRIDAIIKDVAKQNGGSILFTSDRVQSLVAQAEGIPVEYLKPEFKQETLEFLQFFDSETMSVHLKEGLKPLAKKGKPGFFKLVEVQDEILTRKYLIDMTNQILESSEINDSSNIEISRDGAIVVQYEDYRIAITCQPFSEKYEITIIHPIVRLSLSQYSLSDKLMKRLSDRAEGILISGPPGSGKSTLASGLADFYHKSGKIVKTFESPRDLQVDTGITQYTRLDGSFENSADILLLVRPDYTIFDEVRRTEDFRIFSDLRLTGVGMVGVVHANSPIDAIQRFIGKIELGIIPSVLDTVVFVKDGQISKVYELELKVKVPSGMMEQDLARPVIEICDFESRNLEYEIYTFGEENVIIPITKKSTKYGIERLAQEKIKDIFRRFDSDAQVEILSDTRVKVKVAAESIPSIIGRGGSTIKELEHTLNVHIDVEERDSSDYELGSELSFIFSESKTSISLDVDRKHSGLFADVCIDDRCIHSSRIDRKGRIRIPNRSSAGRQIMKFTTNKDDIKVFLKGGH